MSENDERGTDLALRFVLPQMDRWIEAYPNDPERCKSEWKSDEDDGEYWRCSLEPDHSGSLHVALSRGYIVTEEGVSPYLGPSAIWKESGVLFA